MKKISFKQWIEEVEQANYNPLVTQNAVLFPVIHGEKVISSEQALQKMQQLKQTTIWHEGEEAEPIVQGFINQYLGEMPKQSWETTKPQKIDQTRFQQGGLLTSIFGGNNEKEKAQRILMHPFAVQLLSTNKNATILDALEASSKNVPPEEIQKYTKMHPDGWWDWSQNPVSKEAVSQLVQLVANEPNMKNFVNMLHWPATETNIIKFLKIGRNQGFNKPSGAFGNLQKDINHERDLFLLSLIKEKGGIFFAGADHVPNVMNLMQQNVEI